MHKTNSPIPASGSLPNDYQEVLNWKVTEQPFRVISLNILGVLLFIVFGVIFFSLAGSVGKLPLEGQIRLGLGEISAVLAGILLTLVLHELTHGWIMKVFGAKPKYGIIWKGLMFYATAPEYAYHRNNYVAIALAPLILIARPPAATKKRVVLWHNTCVKAICLLQKPIKKRYRFSASKSSIQSSVNGTPL